MPKVFETVKKPWRVCLDLAWEAYCSATLPIAAVILNADGKLVAKGRNRIADIDTQPKQISKHPVAHAELNAILQLDENKVNPKTCTLYALLEPCPMCMGAMRIMGIYNFHYACRDPWAGSSIMTDVVPDMQRRNIKVRHPENTLFETLIGSLQFHAYLAEERPLNQQFMQCWQESLPSSVKLAHHLYKRKTLESLVQTQASAKEMLNTLEQTYQELC